MTTTTTPVSVLDAHVTNAGALVVKFSNGARIRSNRTYTWVLVMTWTPGPYTNLDGTEIQPAPMARVVKATGDYKKAYRWYANEVGVESASSGATWTTMLLFKTSKTEYTVYGSKS